MVRSLGHFIKVEQVNVENDNMGKLYKSHKNMIKGINSTLKSLQMS